MIINDSNLAGLYTGFKTLFNKAFDGVSPAWNQLATAVPSSTTQNAYPWLSDLPGMKEIVGEPEIGNLKQHDYSIKNKRFGDFIEVEREILEDDQYGVYSPRFSMLGDEAARFPDKLVFQTLLAGFSSKGYDGVNYFGTHKIAGENWSNNGGGSSAAWFLLDTSKFIKPLIYQTRRKPQIYRLDELNQKDAVLNGKFIYGVDMRCNAGYSLHQLAYGSKEALTAAAFDTAFQRLMTVKMQNGDPAGVMPTLLIVGGSNRKAALNLLNAEMVSDNATSAVAVSNVNRGVVNLLITPYLP